MDEGMTSPNQQVEMRILGAKQCSKVKVGTKVAAIACVETTIPTMLGVRVIPWERADLNHAAQVLIISTNKTIVKAAWRKSFSEQIKNHAEYSPF